MRCGKCGTETTSDRNFCPECGTPLSNRCGKCGGENSQSAKFCEDCGPGPLFFRGSELRIHFDRVPPPAPRPLTGLRPPQVRSTATARR